MSITLQRAAQARTSLILTQPFFGALALRLKLVEENMGSAATDGVRLILDPGYVAKCSDAQLKGLIAHEVMHCSLGHIWRRDARLADTWNWACDYAVDPIIKRAGMQVPDETINPAWDGWNAERIYEELMKNPDQKPKPRDYLLTPSDRPADPNAKPASEVETEWKVATIAAAQIAKAQGHLPAELERLVMEALQPKVDWKAELRRFVQQSAKNDYSWSYPNKRYLCHGMFLPTLHSESLPPIVVVIDTSGSINGEILAQLRGELESIASETKPEKIHVLYADAEVSGADEFDCDDAIIFKPRGGGGTDFCPAFQWVEDHGIEPACLIYLTDMYGRFPDESPAYPVLWGATSRKEAPWGETVRIE